MQNLIRQFRGKEHGAFVQFIKYGIAGGLATAVHIGCFYIMAGFILRALTADDPMVKFIGLPIMEEADEAARSRLAVINNFVAFLFSNFAGYIINVKWVFEGGRHQKHVEMLLFFVVSGTSVAIGSAITYALIEWYDFTTTVGFVANVVASVLINYVMRKFVIFKG